MNEIIKAAKAELTYDGKRVRSTDEEIMMALAPMFATYDNAKVTEEKVNVYKMLLRDIAPDVLMRAVLEAMKVCKFLPTPADIRGQIEQRAPGPRNDVDPTTLPDIPQKMFRLGDEDDRRERMTRLRRTKGWDKYYA